jgi:hypothetical protein
VLLQELLGEVLQVALGERSASGNSDGEVTGLSGFGNADSGAQVVGATINLDSLLKETLLQFML